MTKGEALYAFLNSFSIPAYTSTSVPSDADFPYITYDSVFDSWGNKVALYVNLWYRTESESIPNAKAREISDAIGYGKYILCDGGAIFLQRGTPWCQALSDPDDAKIKRRYINITMEFLTLN